MEVILIIDTDLDDFFSDILSQYFVSLQINSKVQRLKNQVGKP